MVCCIEIKSYELQFFADAMHSFNLQRYECTSHASASKF